jgi:hypothetical protein
MARTMRTALLATALTSALMLAADQASQTLFDGRSPAGWITTKGQPIPQASVQDDGLNPHKTGSYVSYYEKPFNNFVLDLDYKLSPGCNSGVFVRVGDIKDPVMSGLEIAIDDHNGTGMHDPGAFYDLVGPRVSAQKPTGQWNHMTVTAQGAKLSVRLNDQDVSQIDLDQWTETGKRPDGSNHKFTKVKIKDFNRPGYLGVQDHGQDCWFKNIKLKELP